MNEKIMKTRSDEQRRQCEQEVIANSRNIENIMNSETHIKDISHKGDGKPNMVNGNQNNGLKSKNKSLVMMEAESKHEKQIKEEAEKEEEEEARRESMMKRTMSKFNKKHQRLRRKFNKGLSRYTRSLDDELAYTDGQNSVQTREIFKYAEMRERLAICLGILLMFYAASWQPISVFILATMASLMGQYAKQSSWLNQVLKVDDEGGPKIIQSSSSSSSSNEKVNSSSHHADTDATDIEPLMVAHPFNATTFMATPSPAHTWSDGQVFVGQQQHHHPALGAYSDQLPVLAPLHSFVAPIFDFAGPTIASIELGRHHDTDNAHDASVGGSSAGPDEVKVAVEEILWHESHKFLRRSFEINGSAFLLGLSQLIAFFIGMTLITWVARRQAARLKILYFKSCLHQEVTWYESIDSASGSGSSLNALVDKYEDGIGPKLALLCYFLGHVTLFACTAFYQMLSLASFCTCFVITVGVIIIYLSGGQAVAIGEHALFAKRSLQLAEEILASIRTVFAFNGQQKELTRYQLSLDPVYRKSLIKHLYTALNTSLSKFSIFACFSAYCFYARHLFPPYTDGSGLNKSTILAVMRGGEVSIVNILISIPFMEALQQSKGSIARIYAAIERRSKINPSSARGVRPASDNWQPSISFRMVQFGYADRAGPTQRPRKSIGADLLFSTVTTTIQPRRTSLSANSLATNKAMIPSGQQQELAANVGISGSGSGSGCGDGSGCVEGSGKHSVHHHHHHQSAGRRRRSIIDEMADEFANDVDRPEPPVQFITGNSEKQKINKNVTASRNQNHQTMQIVGGGAGCCGNGIIVANEPRRKSIGLDYSNITMTSTATTTTTTTPTRRINNNNDSHSGNQYNGSGSSNSRRTSGCINPPTISGGGGGGGGGVNTTTTTTMRALDVDRNHQTQDKRVLNRFNLEIKAGQSVALVGPSGSGKSTVLSLLLRLYDITGGQLLIGQHNIKDLNVQWLRNQMGVVTQEPRLFDMSIADNIRLGLPAAFTNVSTNQYQQQQMKKKSKGNGDKLMIDNDECNNHMAGNDDSDHDYDYVMQQVIEASKAAGAHDFIIKLPQGYSTRVGSAGVQLSGGQKQRIAIARALIRKPKILLLDESTSALDTESEMQVLEGLQMASAGRTTITVAHRLKTIKHVDLIVVMSQGQVIECGTHDELMSLEFGTYKKMYQDQIGANEGQKRCCRIGAGAGAVNNSYSGDRSGAKLEDRMPLNKSSELKGGILDQIEFVTPVEPDNNRIADKTSQDEKHQQQNKDHRRFDNLDDNDDLDGSSSSNSKGSSYYDNDDNGDEDDDDDEDDDGDDDDDDDEHDVDDSDDEEYDNHDDQSNGNSSSSSLSASGSKPNFWTLWQFIEPPKWSSVAAIVVCLLAGLVLPMNLIAHSYLFSAFAYNELEQIGDYLYFFGLVLLSFSTFVLVATFLQIILPGYVGEKISIRLRAKTMDSLLHKPMFYFDMDANSAGSLCDRLNSYVSNIQNIAGTRIATILEAVSTLMAGAIFGFGQNLTLSIFCLSFALLVLLTTVIESRIVQRESSVHQKYDAQLAHLMADSLSNIKTIASLNKEAFFIDKFSEIIQLRERGTGRCMNWLRTFLTSLKFVMPALSWSSSMYFGSYLLTQDRIDLQTIFIVCPVVLFAVNDTFRALVFLPELLKARKSIERLYRMNREFSPEVLQTLSLAQQLEQQNRLHLEQMAAATNILSHKSSVSSSSSSSSSGNNRETTIDANTNKTNSIIIAANTSEGRNTTSTNTTSTMQQLSPAIHSNLSTAEATANTTTTQANHGASGGNITRTPVIDIININNDSSSSTSPCPSAMTYSDGRALATAEVGAATLVNNKAKKSISFVEPASMTKPADNSVSNNDNKSTNDNCYYGSDNNNRLTAAAAHSFNEPQTLIQESPRAQIINRRMSNLAVLPTYMRRKSSRLNSLIPRYQSRGKIEFRDVEFAYPNRPSALVLDRFSLSVAPGESVALVGSSGCGKSTCVSILEKFYDYHGGKVTVDGYDLRLVDPNWVRSQIGLVSQEPTLLSYTIGDNIRYGDSSRFVSMNEVVEAARTANIHDFIMSLPDQYDTELSTSTYSSSQLSGGQRQRIAIARALVRNAPILIFDEATSALDPGNEAIVQDALNKARKGRTSITIAHRLSTIKDADKIVVLNDGKVVEIGKHHELIERPDGHYRRLWEKHEGEGGVGVGVGVGVGGMKDIPER